MATLNGHPESKSSENQTLKCVCEEYHRYITCPYLVREVRPSNWQANAEIQAKVEKNIQEAVGKRREILDGFLKKLRDEEPAKQAHFVDIEPLQF